MHSTSYQSELLSRPGAQPALDCTTGHAAPPQEGPDTAGVAWHYGNPLGEQRACHDGGAVVDRSHRTVLAVSGPDASDYLNRLLSQKLDPVTDPYHAQALDLDPMGRILHNADISHVAGTFYLDLPAADARTLAAYLEAMKFWSDVHIDATDLGVLTILGSALDAAHPLARRATVTRPVTWEGIARTDVLLPRAELTEGVDTLLADDLTLAGLMAWTAERVRAREPERCADLDDRAIAHEVPHWIGSATRPGAVHLNKGCYRGQETVSRVHNLGRSPRTLVLAHLDGSVPELPTPGAPITAGGRTVGRLGTVVHDCDYGPIALALIKRSAQQSTQLIAGEHTALSIDPDSIATETGIQPGRAAINRLKGIN